MEIRVGNIKLTSKDGGGFGSSRETIITIDTGEDLKNHLFDVPASELKAAVEALERACWRP